MDDLFLALLLLSFLGQILCLISPRLVGWLIPGAPTRPKGIAMLMGISFLLFVGFGLSVDMADIVRESSVAGVAEFTATEDAVPDSVSVFEDTSVSQPAGELGLIRSPERSGLGISRDSLVRAIHSWNPEFQLIKLEDEEGVGGKQGQTIISILGPERDVTGVVVVVLVNAELTDMLIAGVDLVMLSDAVTYGSSVWVERVIDEARSHPTEQFERSHEISGRLYDFAWAYKNGAISFGFTIQKAP